MLKEKGDQIKIGANQGINKASFFMQNEVKSSIAGQRAEPTSVDTGRFLNSIDVTTSQNQGIIFTDISYAKFLEYGTSRLAPRSHFRNSAARNTEKVKEIMKEETTSNI